MAAKLKPKRVLAGASASRRAKLHKAKSGIRHNPQLRPALPRHEYEPVGEGYDPEQVAEDYAEGVRSGRIVAGRLVKLAVDRYLDDRKRAGERGFYFDKKEARAVCLFFATELKFTKGELAGKPMATAEQVTSGDYEPGQISNFIPSPSQTFILWNVYGWRKKSDGCRRYRTAYIATGKKWGKTEFAAAISLKQGLRDSPPEPGARVCCCATKREQANDLTFRQAAQMVLTSPTLRDEARVGEYEIKSAGATTQPFSIVKAIGSNKNTSDGQDLSGAILDELHAWMRKQHRKFFGTIVNAGGSRRQPLTLMITTAGDDQSDVWNEIEPQYINALEAAIVGDYYTDHLFVFIARLDGDRPCSCLMGPIPDVHCSFCHGAGILPGDDIFDEANWPKANPNFPITPTLAYLQEKAHDAKGSNELKQDFRRYNCNLKSQSYNKAIPREVWNRCGGSLSNWDAAEVVAGGIDIGERDDLCSVAFVARFALEPTHPLFNTLTEEPRAASGQPFYNFSQAGTDTDKASPQRRAERHRYEVISYSWIPSEGKQSISNEPYQSWIEAGVLRVVPGPVINLGELLDEVIRLGKRHGAKQFRADPRNALQFLQGLEKARFEAVEHIQQYYMYNEPIKEWLRIVRRGLLTYNPVDGQLLSWSVNNLVLKRKSNSELMPDRERSVDKIDPAVAHIMGFAEAYSAKARYRKGQGPYVERGGGMWG